MELPLRVIAVLFVGLVAAAAIILFASDIINRSRQNLERFTPEEATQLVIERQRVSMDDMVMFAEGCMARNTATLEKTLCHIVHGTFLMSGAQLDSALTAEGIPHAASTFSAGEGTVWVYYEPYGADSKPRISFLSSGTGYTPDSSQPPGSPPTDNLVVWPAAAAIVNTPLTLTITINNADALAGVEFTLNYNTAHFNPGSFSAGSFLSSCPVDTQTPGVWRIACVKFSGTQSGSGTLGTLTLTPRAQATSQLTITGVQFVDATGTPQTGITTNSPVSITIS